MAAAGNRLIATHDADYCVKQLPAAHEFNGIGNQLAAYQRRPHAFRAHGFAVGDGDGIEFHGSAAGGTNAFFHLGREPPQVKVAGHGFDPGVGYADQRLAEVGVGEANRFKHGARRSPVAPVSNSAAAMFEIHWKRLEHELSSRAKRGILVFSCAGMRIVQAKTRITRLTRDDR